ncbi:MAG: hypothetical protein DRI90_21200 [Deltaproteobacteria bacterium]|nr:MAG: hypothetical protein DRI90_21200 [Deltaproteobacteria bacterium]
MAGHVLFCTTLLFSYLWGRALSAKPLLPTLIPSFNAGHVLVLMFSVHNYFFAYTTWPNTEGLTYTIVLAALWRIARILPRPSWRGSIEIGLRLEITVLACYQQVMMAIAAVAVLLSAIVFLPKHRKRYAQLSAAAAATMALVIAPHYLYVRGFVPDLTPATYLQWQHFRFSDALPIIPTFPIGEGLWRHPPRQVGRRIDRVCVFG